VGTFAPQIELKQLFLYNYYWHFYNLVLICPPPD